MRGLEWSTGSSTQWLLMRVKSLISIEHHTEWSSMVDAHMKRVYGDDVLKRCATTPRNWEIADVLRYCREIASCLMSTLR